jgi:hypothetical protein
MGSSTGNAGRVSLPENAPLTSVEIEILEFERSWWAGDTPKHEGIVDRFSLTSAEYYQQLNMLIDRDVALEHDPMLVRRLRRMRDRRRQERFEEIADGSGS